LFVAQKSPNSWQLVDCVYYPSDTYYMALDFFQLWSVDGGTLVWQVGLASAPFRTYLAGVDRYFAGKIMTNETLATIRAFRSDVERSGKRNLALDYHPEPAKTARDLTHRDARGRLGQSTLT